MSLALLRFSIKATNIGEEHRCRFQLIEKIGALIHSGYWHAYLGDLSTKNIQLSGAVCRNISFSLRCAKTWWMKSGRVHLQR
jgi:hypothetical protein